MEMNRRLKDPEFARASWSEQEFPDLSQQGKPPQPQAPKGGGAGDVGAGALQSFLAPQEGDFDASTLSSLEGQPAPTPSNPPPLDMFAEGMKRRRDQSRNVAQKMRGELTYG